MLLFCGGQQRNVQKLITHVQNHCYVAKYNLSKVRLERMQSAVSPFTVRDLRGGPLEICKAFWMFALLLVDLCVSSALFSESKLSFIVTNLAFVAWKVY